MVYAGASITWEAEDEEDQESRVIFHYIVNVSCLKTKQKITNK